MATKLEKDITRESTVIADGRNIQVTLTKDQEISMKLKGMKSGIVKVKIEDLYNQLTKNEVEVVPIVKKEEPKKSEPVIITRKRKSGEDENVPMINLYDFRSLYLVSGDIPLDCKIKLEQITGRLINEYKNK